jgi:hypothetical protein
LASYINNHQNGEGKGVIVIDLGNNIWIKTWNNSISDTFDHTLIEPDSVVYQQAVKLKESEPVRFSGNLISDHNGADCFRESSLSLRGSMTEPEFVFKFSDLSSNLSPVTTERTAPAAPSPRQTTSITPATHMEHRDCWSCDEPKPVPVPLAQPAQTGSITPDPFPTSPMFQKGLSDRATWETWVTGLTSDYRTGAEYWAGQRSLSHPGSCNGVPAFTAGCREAQSRLAPVDVLRKSEPDYKAGWNSYGH